MLARASGATVLRLAIRDAVPEGLSHREPVSLSEILVSGGALAARLLSMASRILKSIPA